MTALSSPAFANCALQPDGVTVICNTNAPNPYTSSINAITVGSGTLVIPGNGAKVIVNAGAGIATTGAAVQVNNNSSVTNGGSISTTFINAYGIWAGDPNNATSTTVGFGNTLENDGSIKTTGSNSVGIFARTANRTAGNVLINRGRIDTFGSISGTSARSSSAGIRSDSVVASTILNYGIVAAHGAYATIASGNTVAIAGNGVEMAGPGSFTNAAGASVSSDNAYGFYGNGPNANGITVINAGTLAGSRGAILFGAGQSNNTVMLEAGSTTTGSIDAGVGGSNNTLVFDGFSSSAFANAIPNWQLVALRNSANVTLSAASYALSNLSLDAGTIATFTAPALTIGGQINDNGTLVFASAGNLNITAPIQGSGAVTQAGSGTLVLAGAGTYTGPTTIASGTLQAGGANLLSPSSAFAVSSGATLDLGNANQTIGSLAGGGAVTLGAGTLTTGGLGTSTSFDGVIAGSGGLVKTGAGSMTLTGANSYTGGTTISAGALQLGDGGSSGSIVGDVTNNGSLVFNRSDLSTFAGTISGGGSVTQQGTGTTVLTANNNYTGGTAINAGTLQLGDGGSTGSIVGDVTDNGALVFDRSDNMTFAGLISGSGSVTQQGTGTTVLTGNHSYTGGTTISAGTLQLGDGGASGSIVGDVTDNGVLVFNRSDASTFAGAISGSGAVIQQGTGTTVLTGNSSYTGGTTIQAGVLQLGDGGTSGSIVGDVVDNGRLIVDHSDTVTIPGAISGSGSVKQLGSGITIFTGNNTYSGGTVIANGALQLGNGGSTGSIAGDVQDGGTLIFNRADTLTFNGVISDWTNTTPDPIGSLQQNGSGTTVLTALNTYSGTTSVNAGTLVVGNVPISTAAIAGGGAVHVASGATLGGYGMIGNYDGSGGPVSNDGTIAVADALALFQGGSKGDFAINGTLNNNNLIQLAGAGVGNSLFVGNLVGQGNSRIAMNTVLGDDSSNSDLLVVSKGTTSGHTVLDITNVGGLGATTPGNGILVVAASGLAVTTPDAFALGTTLEAGPYQYALFKGARDASSPESWYLRSEDPTPPAVVLDALGITMPAPGTPAATRPYVAYYRPEVSLYTALPSMALNYGKALIGTLHERVGEEEQLRDLSGDGFGASGVWARVIGQDGQWDAKSGGIYRDGPSFDDNMIAVQAGLDLYRDTHDDGTRDFAGVLSSVGHGHGGVTNYDDTVAGNDRFDSYSIGGYWTRFGAKDWYLDGVVQGTWYDAKSSNEEQSLSTHGFGTTLSLEGGYPFTFANGWSLEPQSQVIYQSLHLDSANDSSAHVQFRDADSLAARLGGRASRTWEWDQASKPRLLSGWFFANLWHEFKSDAVTLFSSQTGNIPFHSDLGGSWWELGTGLSAQLSRSASLYATISYDKGFNEGVKAVNGNLGMRINW
jgi:fibronectin-binding autotransporter adhesin